MIEQGFFATGHRNGAATVGQLLVPEKIRLLDVSVLERPAGIVEPHRQAGRDTGVHHDAFGDHVMKAQCPESAQIGRPAQMVGEQRRIERDFPGPIRERVDAATQGNDLSLRHPPRKLQQHRRPAVGKCLHQQREIEADQAANEIGQIVIFHMR
jgi:hypothetical protein